LIRTHPRIFAIGLIQPTQKALSKIEQTDQMKFSFCQRLIIRLWVHSLAVPQDRLFEIDGPCHDRHLACHSNMLDFTLLGTSRQSAERKNPEAIAPGFQAMSIQYHLHRIDVMDDAIGELTG
jgi:hypothetical protein